MPTVLQFRRGTTTQNNNFTGSLGEISVDVTNDSIRVHDGSTAGGFETNAKQAKYADIAERYYADAIYDPGTVLVFGGNNEVTSCKKIGDSKVLGVVSTDPYCIMNSPHREPELTDEYHPPVAILGRVHSKVTGKVSKGDLMVTSEVEGHAESWHDSSFPPPGSILGKAVEDKANITKGIIEILVGTS